MEYRNIGNSGLKVSVIALGSWLTHGVASKGAPACIKKAYDLGVNSLIQPTPTSSGAAEKVVGKLCNPHPGKAMYWPPRSFRWGRPERPWAQLKHIMEQCHASLVGCGPTTSILPVPPLRSVGSVGGDLAGLGSGYPGKILYAGSASGRQRRLPTPAHRRAVGFAPDNLNQPL